MKTKQVTQLAVEPRSMEEKNIAHLAGVFDAVGNINLIISKDSSYRLGYNLRPTLKLYRPNEDDPVLGELVGYCEDNGVRYTITERTHGEEQDTVSIKWVVKHPDSIQRFLEPMMDYLLSHLIEAELMLTQILPAIEADKHRDREGFYELVGLADELRSRSQKGGNVKYTQEYFAEEWSIAE
jgi:hypothetical protein